MQTGGTRARGGGGGEASEQTMCADCQGAYCAGIALTLAACVALDVCQNKKRAGKNVTLPAPLSAVMSPVRLRSCCLRARWRRVRSARPSGSTLVVTTLTGCRQSLPLAPRRRIPGSRYPAGQRYAGHHSGGPCH